MKWNPMAEIRREHTPVGDNAVARGDIFRAIYVYLYLALRNRVFNCKLHHGSSFVLDVTCGLCSEVSVISALINFRFVPTRS